MLPYSMLDSRCGRMGGALYSNLKGPRFEPEKREKKSFSFSFRSLSFRMTTALVLARVCAQ